MAKKKSTVKHISWKEVPVGGYVLNAYIGQGKVKEKNNDFTDVLFWDKDRNEYLFKRFDNNKRQEMVGYEDNIAYSSTGQKIDLDTVFSEERIAASEIRDIREKFEDGGYVSEKITKAKLKAKLYKPTGDFFIEDGGDKWLIHMTPKDASRNSENLSDMYSESIGNGYYGSAYSVQKVLKHKYSEGRTLEEMFKAGGEIEWKINLNTGKNNPDEFEKWLSPDFQKKHRIKVQRKDENFIITGKIDSKGLASSKEWVLSRINKAWALNPVIILEDKDNNTEKIKKLQAVVNSSMVPQSVKDKAQAEIDKLQSATKPSKPDYSKEFQQTKEDQEKVRKLQAVVNSSMVPQSLKDKAQAEIDAIMKRQFGEDFVNDPNPEKKWKGTDQEEATFKYAVSFGSVKNTDFAPSEQGENIPEFIRQFNTMDEAKKAVREFIEENDLGAGNWIYGTVMDNELKSVLGRIAYNGSFIPKTEEISPISEITIEWSEAGDKYDDTTFYNWTDFQEALNDLWKESKDDISGSAYLKTKVKLTWKNGKTITDRIDLGFSSGDYNPDKKKIGDYLKVQESSMYEGNLNIGDISTLEWSDNPKTKSDKKPFKKEIEISHPFKEGTKVNDGKENYVVREAKPEYVIVTGLNDSNLRSIPVQKDDEGYYLEILAKRLSIGTIKVEKPKSETPAQPSGKKRLKDVADYIVRRNIEYIKFEVDDKSYTVGHNDIIDGIYVKKGKGKTIGDFAGSSELRKVTGIKVSKDTIYIPHRLLREAVVKVDGSAKQVKSGDILDGIYVKKEFFGGKIPTVKAPKVSRTQFEDEEFEYEDGGEIVKNFNPQSFTIAEIAELSKKDIYISHFMKGWSGVTPAHKNETIFTNTYGKEFNKWKDKKLTVSDYGDIELSKGSENLTFFMHVYEVDGSDDPYTLRIYSKDNHKGLKQFVSQVVHKLKDGGEITSKKIVGMYLTTPNGVTNKVYDFKQNEVVPGYYKLRTSKPNGIQFWENFDEKALKKLLSGKKHKGYILSKTPDKKNNVEMKQGGRIDNDKFAEVMREFKAGTLTSHGEKVTDRKQAIAIAISESRKKN